jgi:hypothetical protein
MPQTAILYSGRDWKTPVFVAARDIQKNDKINENDFIVTNTEHSFIKYSLIASQNIKLGNLITIGVDTVA